MRDEFQLGADVFDALCRGCRKVWRGLMHGFMLMVSRLNRGLIRSLGYSVFSAGRRLG